MYWLLDNAPRIALDYVLAQEGEDEQDDLPGVVDEQAEILGDALAERPGNGERHTAGEMRAHLDWLAKEAGIVDELAPDGTVAYSPGEGLIEKVHTVALHELQKAENQARNVERHIIEKRRAHLAQSGGAAEDRPLRSAPVA